MRDSQTKCWGRRDADTLAVDEVDRARTLRAEYTNAIRHAKGRGTWNPPPPDTMEKYWSGDLRREANEATRRSGYGAIRDEQDRIVEMLSPIAFEDGL